MTLHSLESQLGRLEREIQRLSPTHAENDQPLRLRLAAARQRVAVLPQTPPPLPKEDRPS